MKDELPANILAWLDEAIADATRRGLPQLEPLLQNLARSTAALRAADWNDSVETREGDAPPASPQAAARPGGGSEDRR